jgi:signal transduction histidine kinase
MQIRPLLDLLAADGSVRLFHVGLGGGRVGARGMRMRALTARWVADHATQARICLRAQDTTLRFTVSDDGTGYAIRCAPMGSGLRNMADRLAALNGRLEILAAPGRGTTISGHLPVSAVSSGQPRGRR